MRSLIPSVALVALSPFSGAQYGSETLGAYFDAMGTQTSTNVAPFEAFQVYFITDNVPVGVAGYEFLVDVPPELLIVGVTAHPVSSSLDIDSSNEGFIVGSGVCMVGPGPLVLAEFTCMALAPANDLRIHILPTVPSSFGGTAPGYAECTTLALYPFADAYSGGARVDVQNEGSFCACDAGASAPCGNVGGPGSGCANSFSTTGATLHASGTASASASTLVLHAGGVPPQKPGLYFQGTTQVAGGAGLIFGDGLRCAGGAVSRLEVRIADAAGASMTTIDLATGGGVSGGDTRYYQLWYRDPVGSPCAQHFNTTNALEITWTN